ncbi:acyltransferase family protein [Aequorivita lipolytica]|uniref:Acyltransferase family protein n=1 Tax=Aequorivita lipolytica TaxID=153267 RepID=A0A5C6YKX0_9FLAO|nr:acyltransferase family protein [Aequorivita lipolytica]TXD67847.1 acyltransferase family protein [Aequorivita lipolytica]SRX54007.1 Glucans biosynthesis protein C [Aequorivita lipolytica]
MERRYDLDWLRVMAFALLIFYHIGMFFVPWEWHIKNNIIYEWLEYPMVFLNRWRMPLLFIISGMGTAFSLGKRSAFKFSRERISRLFIPLLFGMLVIVPPQIYIERIAHLQFTSSYLDFWPTHAFDGKYPTGNLSWHHLWFLPYILAYSLILLPIFIFLRKHPKNKLIRLITKLTQTRFGLYWMIVPLLLMEWFLDPFFPITHGLFDDWFNFFYNLTLFFYGFLLISVQKSFFETIQKHYKTYLFTGIIAFSVFLYLISTYEDGIARHFIEAFFNQINMWSWVLALFGLSSVFLNRKSNIILYCNRAVYPFYILHQTVIIILAYQIMNLNWSLLTKFSTLVVGTFSICWILYEFLIKRFFLLNIVMGVKPKRKLSNIESIKNGIYLNSGSE